MPESSARTPIVRNQTVPAAKLAIAKALRRRATPAERALWRALRGSRLAGLHFRRQQAIGNYLVDFYCEAARLAIELDGDAHAMRSREDRDRDEALGNLGIKVLRIPNQNVLDALNPVAEWIAEQAIDRIRNRKTT